MNDTPILASAPCLAARPGTPSRLADVLHRHGGLTALRSIVATWHWRKSFRWELEQKSRDNPHFIDDIGLKRWQVEVEIAKPFWKR